jgi:sterol 3beta-glucosyltransferase
MRITILTYGSRGDFQPFLALAVALQKAGHSPNLAAPARFAGLASQYQVPFSTLAGDPAELSVRFNDAGSNPVRMVRSIRDYVYQIAPQVTRDARQALQGADLVVHSFLFTTGGHTFARELGIPDISVQTFPVFTPTRFFPNVVFSFLPPGPLSYLSHWLVTQVFWHGGNAGQPRFSKKHPQDFPSKLYWPFKRTDDRPLTPLVYACSPTILPRPADWSADNIHIPGSFFLDEPDYQPPLELIRFLENGEPPVCISFGSMLHRDADRIERILAEALTRTGQRGIVLTGWGGAWQQYLSPALFALPAAPHAWLLPRCKAVLHHGGAGTTAAGLRAGIPNIVIPFAGDQPFWGRRVAALAAGPKPIPVKHLTTTGLCHAIQAAISSSSMQANAARLGEKIRLEQGVSDTVRLIEQSAAIFRRL